MTKFTSALIGAAALSFSFTPKAQAHCEVPCGIYTDQLRIHSIEEDIKTIEKASKKIIEISAQEKPNYNQLVRWVTNKEKHAEKIQEAVYQYFMTQRIKLPKTDAEKTAYTQKLALLHQMLVFSMKTKQGTDLNNVEKLKQATAAFEKAYFTKKAVAH